jgi:hypothetical protein
MKNLLFVFLVIALTVISCGKNESDPVEATSTFTLQGAGS